MIIQGEEPAEVETRRLSQGTIGGKLFVASGLCALAGILLASAPGFFERDGTSEGHLEPYSLLLWGGLALLFSGGIAFWLYRQIAVPVEQLVEAVRAATSEQGDRQEWDGVFPEIRDLVSRIEKTASKHITQLKRFESEASHNRRLFLESIHLLAAAADDRVPGKQSHSERVARWAVAIGEELGLSTAQIETLRVASLLHDVGKIGLPAEVLEGSAGRSEYHLKRFREHPSLGATLVRKLSHMQEVAEMILHHHEYFDGSGYPGRLSGQNIPLLARVLTVADDLDELTSIAKDETGGPTLKEAVKVIESHSNTRYDPQIVAALKTAMRKGRIAPGRSRDRALRLALDTRED